MAGPHPVAQRLMAALALSVSTALVVSGCVRPSARRPATTTTAPTTTVAGHDHGGHGGDGQGDAGPDDKGWSQLSNGHQAEHGAVPLDEATQKELDRQIAITQELVAKYPTVQAAVADGYRPAGPFSPGLGSHFMKLDAATGAAGSSNGLLTDEQIRNPVLVFNGGDPDAPIAGFMYSVMGTKAAPEGFAGPNDHWHYHTNVCLKTTPTGIETPLGADRDFTVEQCSAVGGNLLAVTGYMVHVWSVPGWENPGGLFAEANPKLTCKDGTYHRIPLEKTGTNKTLCRDEAVIS